MPTRINPVSLVVQFAAVGRLLLKNIFSATSFMGVPRCGVMTTSPLGLVTGNITDEMVISSVPLGRLKAFSATARIGWSLLPSSLINVTIKVPVVPESEPVTETLKIADNAD